MHPRSARHSDRGRGGFTLIEVLAAMLFMAIVIPVAVQGLLTANRAGVVADRQRDAAALADSLLTEMMVTEDWRYGASDGDFEDEWPGFRWVLETEDWEVDTILTVSVEVFYEVQGQEHSVRLSTLGIDTDEVEE